LYCNIDALATELTKILGYISSNDEGEREGRVKRMEKKRE
jgi:hypothetical protein